MLTTGTYKLTLKEYKSFFNKLYTSLCLFSNKYVEDIEMSKDIVQEVFIKVWEDQIEFKSENNVKSYLYTSVKNKSLDYLKSKVFRSTSRLSKIKLEKLEELESDAFFFREVVLSEASNIIDDAVNKLPNKCAEIIRLSIKGLSNKEIAEELNLSINTIKTQKKIAYKRLKPILKDYFIYIIFIFNTI